jgi:phosphoribosyl 1,2-cyclic phosphodiesterase
MPSDFFIKLWGVRGSIPTPGLPVVQEEQKKQFLQGFFDNGFSSKADIDTYLSSIPHYLLSGWGGNTMCVEASAGTKSLMIDCGSGLRNKGLELMAGPCGKGKGEVHILFTHFHWDHLAGLPFFIPIFIPGNKIHLYAVQDELEQVLKTLFQRPYFPVSYEQLLSSIVYHKLEPREKIKINGFSVIPYQLDHPDPCWGYKITKNKKTYSHCVDTECKRYTAKQLGEDIGLYQKVDLMLFDAQYTLLETIEKVDWGHSSANLGLDLAIWQKIKKVIFTHHDPFANDEKLGNAETDTAAYYDIRKAAMKEAGKPFFEVDWMFAKEGMEISV